MKKISLFALMITAAMLLPTVNLTAKSAPAKKTFDLSYKIPAGSSFTLKSEATSTIKSEQMGQTINVDMVQANETVCRVLSTAADGTMKMEMEFKARKQSAKSEMGNNDTDFSSWIGKKVGFSVSPVGVLSDYTGFDKLPEISSATGEKVTGEMVQKGMSEQFFKLPGHEMKIGDTWTDKDSMMIPYGGSELKSISSTTYKIAETVTKDGIECLRIETVTTAKLSGTFEQQQTEIEMTRETKASGNIWFALDKGFYCCSESTSVGNSQIYVAAASMTIPQEINSKSSVKVVFE